MFPFDPPEKIRENLWFSDVFRGDQKGTLGKNGLKDLMLDLRDVFGIM